MPLYAFRCDGCGPFDLRRGMDEYHLPAVCPTCGAPATRVLTAPNLYRTSPAYRRARGLEERSADAPQVVTRPPEGFGGRPLPGHRHDSPPWVLGH